MKKRRRKGRPEAVTLHYIFLISFSLFHSFILFIARSFQRIQFFLWSSPTEKSPHMMMMMIKMSVDAAVKSEQDSTLSSRLRPQTYLIIIIKGGD